MKNKNSNGVWLTCYFLSTSLIIIFYFIFIHTCTLSFLLITHRNNFQLKKKNIYYTYYNYGIKCINLIYAGQTKI